MRIKGETLFSLAVLLLLTGCFSRSSVLPPDIPETSKSGTANATIEELNKSKALDLHQLTVTKVLVERYPGDPEAVAITDPAILQSIPQLFAISHRYEHGYPNGYQSEVGQYMYTLYTDSEEFQVKVVGRKMFGFDNEDFLSFYDVHHLGAAFVRREKEYGAHIFTKIQQSGLMIGQIEHTYANFSEFRIKGVASVIMNGVFLEQKPDEAGKLLEALTFFNQGDEITANVYPNYIHIIDGDIEYWLEAEDGGQSILSGLSAG